MYICVYIEIYYINKWSGQGRSRPSRWLSARLHYDKGKYKYLRGYTNVEKFCTYILCISFCSWDCDHFLSYKVVFIIKQCYWTRAKSFENDKKWRIVVSTIMKSPYQLGRSAQKYIYGYFLCIYNKYKRTLKSDVNMHKSEHQPSTNHPPI